ncbi:MAG: hypothetical protein M1818_008063 [Claussenomyces sp. TS43310]|nr:MAG: hypothetical protein M1818_008063 [Claussenomyces sp. TS43310]
MRRATQLAQSTALRCLETHIVNASKTRPRTRSVFPTLPADRLRSIRVRCIATSLPLAEKTYGDEGGHVNQRSVDDNEAGMKVKEISHDGQLDEKIGEAKELQKRTPWHREGSDAPPVRRLRSAGAMTKGKLLTTPSRLLKLILPLTTLDKNSDRKDIEPLALLVHPQQPLSYLERLIQSELPMIQDKDGKDKVPEVFFRAEDSARDEPPEEAQDEDLKEKDSEEGSEEQVIDGKITKTGKVSKDTSQDDHTQQQLRGGPGEGGVESYSGLGHESSEESNSGRFVRWSSSTEIGDFIRDAARGKEFAVEIEGAAKEIRVGVPSFNDRTHYLRLRLTKTARRLEDLAGIKKECDDLAHLSGQRIAMGGFGVLLTWWGGTYYFTFMTSYGWDTMEPITYLAGLSTIMLGYLYFLYHNREVSYRAALHLTVSHRQNQLYTAKGFDVHKWETLIEEANALRKEIKLIADEYDVDWDEKQDNVSDTVHDALRKERRRKDKSRDAEDDDDDAEQRDAKGKETKKTD